MVRAQGKQTNDDRKEGKKKSSGSSSKKKPETGSWPCKMDGCKKVFAREADLKRHQRTTKTHSIPGFQCPQCDATFTRTDALRRHQKSRHNGVVIEPAEEKGKSGDGVSSGSRSPSPGGTPSRSQEEGSMNGSPAPQSNSAGPSSGPSSYYRPHTMQDGGYYAGYPPPPRPPPPGMMMDPHYPHPIGLPTSATRSHQANWQAPPAAPPWGPEGHPMGPPPGMYMPSYYPSPYYRHPGMGMPPHPGAFPPQINPDLLAQSNDQMSGVAPPESALRNTSPDKPESLNQGKSVQGNPGPAAEMPAQPVSHNGDSTQAAQSQQPSQQVPGGVAQNGGDEGPDASTLMAAAALQAVLAFQKEQELRDAISRTGSMAPDASAQAPPVPQSQPIPPAEANSSQAEQLDGAPTATATEPNAVFQAGPDTAVAAPSADAMAPKEPLPNANEEVPPTADSDVHVDAQPSEVNVEVKRADASAAPHPPLPPAQQMEQLMTEDGMPMLNPAELLTQESLASPPPS